MFFQFLHDDLQGYISSLEEQFYPKVEWMYQNDPVKPNIPTLLREFGFAVERDTLVLRIQLWRAFVKSSKGGNEFNGRPSRIKLRPLVAANWNYKMGNVDVAHRLMLQTTPQLILE